MFKHNFHTHTHYCDGSSAPEEYVIAALEAGLESIGFSGHAPVPFENKFAIKDHSSLEEYVREILEIKNKYRDAIRVYLALETDYIPGVTQDFNSFKQDYGLDYLIGSVHHVKNEQGDRWFIDGPDRSIWQEGLENYFGGNIKTAVSGYFHQLIEMAETQKPDVIGHLDKIKMHNRDEYFLEEDPWYFRLVMECLEAIKQADIIVEVNTRGLYKQRTNALFPGMEVLKEMQKMGIPVTISSDAHKPEEVSLLLSETAQILAETAYKEVYIYSENGWKPIPLV